MASKKKLLTSAVAVATAATLLLGGTFAWQSISQTALNEKEGVVNPGGRLHSNFNGTNMDIYAENFADDDIFARIRLDEYFEIVANKGVDGAETTEVVTAGATKGELNTYITHKFDSANATDTYWNWQTGGAAQYMPTFNKNKDSLAADINGTLDNDYEDYVDYSDEANAEKTGTEIYDGDDNTVDEIGSNFTDLSNYANNIVTVENQTHTVKSTETANALISMEEWLALNGGVYSEETHGNYWVYDTDGWCYWSSPIKAGTATGLLLDGISLKTVMNDSYYYAINAVGQFITADDLGKEDGTGFYDETAGVPPTAGALKLLKAIGVAAAEDDEDNKENTEKELALTLGAKNTSAGFTYVAAKTGQPIAIMSASDADLTELTVSVQATPRDVFNPLTEDTDYTYDNGKLTIISGANLWKGARILVACGDETANIVFEADNTLKLVPDSGSTEKIYCAVVAKNEPIILSYDANVAFSTNPSVTFSNLRHQRMEGVEYAPDLDELSINGTYDEMLIVQYSAEGLSTMHVGYICVQAAADADDTPEESSKPIYTVYASHDEDAYYDMIFVTGKKDSITNAEAATLAGVSEDKVAYVFKQPDVYDVDKDTSFLEDECLPYIKKTSSVRFANKVQPKCMQVYFYEIGTELAKGQYTAFDWTNLDTSKVEYMNSCFYMANVRTLDLSTWNTCSVIDPWNMFGACRSLETIEFGDNWDTSKMIKLARMFAGCDKIKELDLSSFDIRNLKQLNETFYGMYRLEKITVGEGWDTSRVRYWGEMFQGCASLTTLENFTFNTKIARHMDNTFYGCSNLQLDCSDWVVGRGISHARFNENAPGITPPSWK